MSDFIPENVSGCAPVRPEDGPQEGEVFELPEFDNGAAY
mgnify:CR=1 FL=1